jgi:hypothetical protein
MLRVVLGLLKGGILGAGIGFLAWKLGVGGGLAAIMICGIIGAAAGIVAGRPPWRHETLWTPLIKGIVGFGVGVGLYLGARKLLGGTHLAFATGLGAPDKALVEIPFLIGPAIGALWGILVELDDSVGAEGRAKAGAPAKPQPPSAPARK